MPTGVYPHKPLSQATRDKLRKPMSQATRNKLSEMHRSYALPNKDVLADLYYGQGLSIRAIAKQLTIPAPSLFTYMKRYQLSLRSRGEAHSLYLQKHPELRQRRSELASKALLGRKQSPETIAKRVASRKGYRHSQETRAKMSKAQKGRRWSREQREKYLPVVMKNRRARPTSLELKVVQVIENHALPYKYVGDGYTWIAGRCPDFLNVNGQKIVVEVFSRWWHDPNVNPRVRPEHTEEATLAHYAQYGFECVVLWEEELSEAVIVRRLCPNPK